MEHVMQLAVTTAYGLESFADRFANNAAFPGGNKGLQVRTATQTDASSQAFAQDIVNRIQTTATPSQEENTTGGATVQNASESDSTQDARADATSELQRSLAQAVDYVRDNFGDTAAQATMGLVYKQIGNEGVTEDNLGKGLLNALRFIDRNFGFAAGDKVMAYFNQDVNKAINERFDNGLMETFYAAPARASANSQGLSLNSVMQEVTDKNGVDVAQTLMESLEQALAQGEKPAAALRKATTSAAETMAAQYGGDARTYETLMSDTLSPLLFGGAQNTMQPGQQLNIVV